MNQQITLKNELTEVETLHNFVDEVCAQLHFDDMETSMINLALEEVVVNVINYAYPSGEEGEITIVASSDETDLAFDIIDSGAPFDPTAVADADITLDVDDRPIGGLGIYLARNIMTTMTYHRTPHHNILTLTKSLPQ